jgi:nucleoside-diphosphate-sugar epimerase
LARDEQVLVTGANGFVGSHLVEALLVAGYRVRGMVRRSSDLSYLRGVPVELVYGDVRTGEGLEAACEGVWAVCHCAALTRAPDRATFHEVNTDGAEALARASLAANPELSRFLFVSSQAAAGPSREAGDCVDEARSPQPVTWYGESKQAAEQALAALAEEQGLPLTIVRPSAVLGPRDRDFFEEFRLIQRGVDLQIGRDDGRRISLIYVRDLAALLVRALEAPAAVGQTYFVTGLAPTHAELSAAIAFALGKRPVRIHLPEGALGLLDVVAKATVRLTGQVPLLNEQRLIDLRQPYWLCSSEKVQRELGFEASYTLDEAVQETADWYREQGWL